MRRSTPRRGLVLPEVFVKASLSADLLIDTEQLDVEAAVGRLVAYVAGHVPLADAAAVRLIR